MSYDITQTVKVTNASPNVDWYYGGDNGYWSSISAAKTGVPSAVRMIGKTVAIKGTDTGNVLKEYWWRDGITDNDLVEKTGGGDTSDCVKFDSNGVVDISNYYFEGSFYPKDDDTYSLGSSSRHFWRAFINEVHTGSLDHKYEYTYERESQSFTDIYESNLRFVPQYNQHNDCEFTLHLEGGEIYGNGVDIKFPNEDGTLALTSDIPDIPLSLEENTIGFSIAGGTTEKTLTVSENYTLGAACAKSVTDNSSSVALTSSDTNLVTGRSVYYHCSNGYAPKAHASSATTYGVGTSSNYGHMKLGAANQNGATAANGVCAPNGHTHSQYLTSHQTVTSTSSSCSIQQAGSSKSFTLPLRFVGSSRVPGTYYVSGITSYGLGTPISGSFVAGDVLIFTEYSGIFAVWLFNGSSWSSINLKKA